MPDLLYSHLRIHNPALSMMIAALIVRIVWRYPEWGLAAFIGSNRLIQNVSIYIYEPFGMAANRQLALSYLVAAVLAAYAFHGWYQGEYAATGRTWSWWKEPVVIMVGLLFGMQLVDKVVRPSLGYGYHGKIIMLFLNFFPFFATIAVVRSRQRLRSLSKAVFVCILVRQAMALLAIAVALGKAYSLSELRVSAWILGRKVALINPVDALFWGAALFVISDRDRERRLAMLLLPVSAFQAIVTQTRVYWLQIVAGGLLLLIRLWAWKRESQAFGRGGCGSAGKRWQLWTAVLCLLIAMLVSTVAWGDAANPINQLIQLVTERLLRPEVENPLSGRSDLWLQSYEAFLSSPLVGVGMGHAISPQQYFVAGRYVSRQLEPHNWFLGTLGRYGLIGLAPLLGFVVCSLQRLRLPERATEADFLALILVSQALVVAFLVSGLAGGGHAGIYSAVALLLASSFALGGSQAELSEDASLGRAKSI